MSAMRSMSTESPDKLGTHSSGILAAVAALRPSRSSRILVIDESPAVRKLIETQLSRLGCSVVATGDGLAGLELALRGTFDVVVVTESVQGIRGPAICRILSVLPSERRPLIIFHSAGSLIQSEARSAGADLVLSNDVLGDNLVAWVCVYLSSRPARKSARKSAPKIQGTSIASLAAHSGLVDDHAWAGSGIV
jgi:CheY-like chemotaxis protein